MPRLSPGDEEYGAVKREKIKRVKLEDDDGGLGESSGGIDVKTKFPVARIKRIMQADEDVGKVAQVTPVAVGTFVTFQSIVIC